MPTNKPRMKRQRLAKIVQHRFGDVLCCICGKTIWMFRDCSYDADSSLEHIIPVSMGGGNNIENLLISHKMCNAKRGNKVVEFHYTHNDLRDSIWLYKQGKL